jgi:hypothetical protein
MTLRKWRRVSLIVRVSRVSLLGLALVLVGCPMPLPAPPPVPQQYPQENRTVDSSRSADSAYRCAARLFAEQPQVANLFRDETMHIIRGEWHRAVDIVIVVDPLPSSSRMRITADVIPNRNVGGKFDEADTLAALLQKHCS